MKCHYPRGSPSDNSILQRTAPYLVMQTANKSAWYRNEPKQMLGNVCRELAIHSLIGHLPMAVKLRGRHRKSLRFFSISAENETAHRRVYFFYCHATGILLFANIARILAKKGRWGKCTSWLHSLSITLTAVEPRWPAKKRKSRVLEINYLSKSRFSKIRWPAKKRKSLVLEKLLVKYVYLRFFSNARSCIQRLVT